MEDVSVFIYNNFGIKAKKIIKEKSGYIINTDDGVKALKKSFDEPSHILFQHEIKEAVNKKGFLYTDRFTLSESGEPYAFDDDTIFVLSSHLPQSDWSFADAEKAEKAAETLSLFHIAARDITFTGKVYYGTADTIAYYKKCLTELAHFKKSAAAGKRMSDFDIAFIKTYEYFTGQINEAISILQETNVTSATQAAHERGNVCLSLVKEDSFTFVDNTTYVANFSQAIVDNQLVDVYKLIQRTFKSAVKSGKKSDDIFDGVLNAYRKYNDLTDEHMRIISAYFTFPHKYIKICNQYFHKRRTFIPNAIISRFDAVVALKEWNEWAKGLIRK